MKTNKNTLQRQMIVHRLKCFTYRTEDEQRWKTTIRKIKIDVGTHYRRVMTYANQNNINTISYSDY